MKIKEIIVIGLVTSFLAIFFTIIVDEIYSSMFDFYDVALIFIGIISAVLGLTVTTKFIFRFEFGKGSKDGLILAIFSWIIYFSYFFIQYNVLYAVDLAVLIGLFIGFFLYSILLRLDHYNKASKTIPRTSAKIELSVLNIGLGIVPILIFGGLVGVFVSQFVWILFGQIQMVIGMGMPFAAIYSPPLIFQIGWIIVGALGLLLKVSSRGKII